MMYQHTWKTFGLLILLVLVCRIPLSAQTWMEEEDMYQRAMEQMRIDSLLRPENRYYIPDSVIAWGDEMQRFTTALSEVQLLESRKLNPDLERRVEPSDLMRYMRIYHIMDRRIYPAKLPPIPESVDMRDLRMSPLFMPMVFGSRKSRLQLEVGESGPIFENRLRIKMPSYAGEQYLAGLQRETLRQLEVSNLLNIRYRMADLPKYERIETTLASRPPIRQLGGIDLSAVQFRGVDRVAPEYSYWYFRGRLSGQMTQTFISPNWSSGGRSNMSGVISFYWKGNYNDRKNIQFDNFIDAKLGVNTNSDDTLRLFNVSTDQFHASSKLGVRAIKNWYYSLSADFYTQALPNYKANTRDLTQSFLSPAKFLLGLGVDYKLQNRKKTLSLSVNLNPLSYRMNVLLDTLHFDATKHGVKPGKHTGHEFGFTVKTTLDYKITEDLSWNSYFYYYSNFHYIDSEWRNTVDFRINQYFSTQLYLHFKIDDRLKLENLIQMKEFLSIGVTYYW